MQWAWRSRGLIREQNDHLFLQSDEETLTCLIGAFVWRAIFGVGCLTALLENSDLKDEKAVLLMITRHNYNGFASCWQRGRNETSRLDLRTQKSTPSRPRLSHTSSRDAHTNRHTSL